MRQLSRGMDGADVTAWQAFLITEGVLNPGNAIGHFGPKTEQATKDFQAAHGLDVDGVVGPNTLQAATTRGFVEPAAGVGNFFTQTIVIDPRFHSSSRVADVLLLEPILRQKVQAIITDAKAHGMDLMVYETYRSVQRQEELFNSGASMLKDVGVHHYGLACDITKVVNDEPSWKGDFSLLGELARVHRLVWGGSWTSIMDAVHVQRCSLGKQAGLFNGSWYPDNSYDPLND